MKKPFVLAVALCLLAVSSSTLANPQHDRMKRCNQEAKEKSLKGEERKQFMSGCLSGKHTTQEAAAGKGGTHEATKTTKTQPAVPADKAKDTEAAKAGKAAVVPVAATKEAAADPKEKMKACNRQATEKSLKGEERKRFIGECLKG